MKLFWISRNFVKFQENFVKQEIKYFAKNLQNYKNKIFCSHPTPTQSAVCYSPSPPAAKRFFIAARQCYLDLKTLKEPYFSILASIILWFYSTIIKEELHLHSKSQYYLILAVTIWPKLFFLSHLQKLLTWIIDHK